MTGDAGLMNPRIPPPRRRRKRSLIWMLLLVSQDIVSSKRNWGLTPERVNNRRPLYIAASSVTVYSTRSQDTPIAGTSLNPVATAMHLIPPRLIRTRKDVYKGVMLLSIGPSRLRRKCTIRQRSRRIRIRLCSNWSRSTAPAVRWTIPIISRNRAMIIQALMRIASLEI